MRNRRGVGGFGKSRWLYVLAALILVASGRASAADRGRSGAHRTVTTAPSQDVAPVVVTDPRSGAVVKIWSRGDGFTAKLAWARLRGNGWGPAHDLTFGLGIDRDPAVGLTSAGPWLFWRNERGEVYYAPLELASGRLLGVPAPLLSGGGILPGRPGRPGGTVGTEGGVDAPVVHRNCADDDPICIAQRAGGGTTNPGPYTPPVIPEGGVDTPVVGAGGIVIVSSDPGCEKQIVSITQTQDSLLVLEVDGAGRVSSRQVVSLESGISAEEAGQFFLLQSCTP